MPTKRRYFGRRRIKRIHSGGSYPQLGRLPGPSGPYYYTRVLPRTAAAQPATQTTQMAPSYTLKEVASAARDVSTILKTTKEAVDAGKDLYNAFPGREIMAGGRALYDWAMPRQTAQMGTQMTPAAPAPSPAIDYGVPIDGNYSPRSPLGQERFPSVGLPWVPEDRPYVPAPKKGIAQKEDKAFGPYTIPARKKNRRPRRPPAPVPVNEDVPRPPAPVPVNEDVPMVDAKPPAPLMGDGFTMGRREGGMGGGALRATHWSPSAATVQMAPWTAAPMSMGTPSPVMRGAQVAPAPVQQDLFPQYTAQRAHQQEIDRLHGITRGLRDPYINERRKPKPWGFE